MTTLAAQRIIEKAVMVEAETVVVATPSAITVVIMAIPSATSTMVIVAMLSATTWELIRLQVHQVQSLREKVEPAVAVIVAITVVMASASTVLLTGTREHSLPQSRH